MPLLTDPRRIGTGGFRLFEECIRNELWIPRYDHTHQLGGCWVVKKEGEEDFLELEQCQINIRPD